MTEFALDPRIPAALIALLAAALLGGAFYSLHRARTRVPLAVRGGIMLLRAIAVLALVVALLGPSHVTRDEVVIKTPVLLLADASSSMTLRDTAGGSSRRIQFLEWTRENESLLARARETCDLMAFDFARDITPAPEWTDRADGRITAIGDALAAAMKRTRGRPGASIVLFSDGRTTSGSDPIRAATQAADRGVRIHTVAIGSANSATARDRRVNNLVCPSVAQLDASFPINAYISALGDKGATFTVTLRIDDKEVESRDLIADQESFSTKLSFMYTPRKSGETVVRVTVGVGDGEQDTSNNAMQTVVRVAQKELRILYIDGKLRWDYTFLRRALAQIPGAHFQTVNLFTGVKADAPTPESLAKYNVLILGDVPARLLGDEFLIAVEEAVRERDLGVLFLAGPSNLGMDGGYGSTKLAAVLPFECAQATPPEEKPTTVRVTSQGMSHFAMTLEKDYGQNVASWKSMPKLETLAKVGPIKPAATTIADAESGDPILVAQPYGKGRVLAFLAETSWRWALESEATAEKYRRFWHQSILWLAKKDKQARRISIDLPRYLYLAGDGVDATISVEDPPGTPVADAAVDLLVQGPDASAPATRASYYGGAYHATITPNEPGEYTITASARSKGDDLGRAAARFLVVAPDSELDQPAPSPETLQAIAVASGGSFRPLAEASQTLEQILKDSPPTRTERVHRRTLWDRAWLILLFVAALSVEWMMRKASRLL